MTKWQIRQRYLAWASLWSMGMSLCASCGLQLSGEAALCPHHHCVYGDDWAVANRIMCDFFHRKKIPPRLAQQERAGTDRHHGGDHDGDQLPPPDDLQQLSVAHGEHSG